MKVAANGGEFKPIDAGSYSAICSRVIDQGTQETEWQGTKKHARKVLIGWEIPEVEIEFDGEKQPALVMKGYTASLHEKARLRADLESWRGRKFTPEELAGFDLKALIGAPCMLNVVHSEDGQYANVSAIMALPRGMPKPTGPQKLIHLDLDNFDADIFEILSDRMKDKIKASPEYKAATGGHVVSENPGGGGPRESFPADLDDEIPF